MVALAEVRRSGTRAGPPSEHQSRMKQRGPATVKQAIRVQGKNVFSRGGHCGGCVAQNIVHSNCCVTHCGPTCVHTVAGVQIRVGHASTAD